MNDIVIIGAGTAGLSAAIYSARAGKDVLIIEEQTYGGQIIVTTEIENYPAINKISGYEFSTNLYNQAMETGAKIEYCQANKISKNNDIITIDTSKGNIDCKALIIATGAKNRHLNVPGEDNLIGKGVSYCAVCDGAFYKNKDVAVVGGGNTALDDAVYLSKICNKVYLIHRRDSFNGEQILIDQINDAENIELIFNSNVTEIIGQDKLQAIKVKNSENEEYELELSGIFIAIGHVPANEKFSPPINLDNYGYIIAGEDCKTNINGIYTAGDCRTKSIRQLTTAASDGSVAALAACDYINSQNKK